MKARSAKTDKACWPLGRKLGLAAWVYTVSILINVAISSACLLMYFRPAFREADTVFQQQQRLEQVRAVVRQHRRLLEEPGATHTAEADAADTMEALSEVLRPLKGWAGAGALDDRARDSLREALAGLDLEAGQASAEQHEAMMLLESRLTEAIGGLAGRRDFSLERASRAQQWVTGILATNSVVGAALCAVGLWYVRRWVVQPASVLGRAAGEIREGDFEPHIVLPCDDEMGDLGREMTEMASQISRLQGQLVDRERLSAAGDMIGRVESRMRGPLGVIRESARSSLVRGDGNQELAGCQERILATVGQFEAWLAQLKAGLTTASGELVPVELAPLLSRVSAAVRPALDRHGVALATEVEPGLPEVCLDPLQFEHAMISLVTNAIQASTAGQTVTIRAVRFGEAPGEIRLEIVDRGTGIPENLIQQIFAPFFTTKPEGSGIGLGLARSIIQQSGGELSVSSTPGEGSCFVVRLPMPAAGRPSADGAAAKTFADRPEFADPS